MAMDRALALVFSDVPNGEAVLVAKVATAGLAVMGDACALHLNRTSHVVIAQVATPTHPELSGMRGSVRAPIWLRGVGVDTERARSCSCPGHHSRGLVYPVSVGFWCATLSGDRPTETVSGNSPLLLRASPLAIALRIVGMPTLRNTRKP